METKKILKNKKAQSGDMYLSPWMFVIWAVVGIGIAIGILIFYSSQADVRKNEADALSIRALDCLSENFAYSEIFGEGFNLHEKCAFNKKLFEQKAIYYLNVTAILTDSGKIAGSIYSGDRTLDLQCEYQKLNVNEGKKQEKNFAQCAFNSVLTRDIKTGKEYILYVKSASIQLEN